MRFSTAVQNLPEYPLIKRVVEFGIREFDIKTADDLRIGLLEAATSPRTVGNYDVQKHKINFRAPVVFAMDERDTRFTILHELRHVYQRERGLMAVTCLSFDETEAYYLYRWTGGGKHPNFVQHCNCRIQADETYDIQEKALYQILPDDCPHTNLDAITARPAFHVYGYPRNYKNLPEEADANKHATLALAKFNKMGVGVMEAPAEPDPFRLINWGTADYYAAFG